MTYSSSTPTPQRTVRDQLYLLAHHDDGQPVIHIPSLSLGLAAAVMIDLVLTERVTVTSGRIGISTVTPTGDAISDATLTAVLNTRQPRDLRPWLKWLSTDLYERTSSGLYAAGHVTRKFRRRLFGPDENIYRPTSGNTATYMAGPVFRAVNDSRYIEPPTYALAGLVGVLRLERVIGNNLSTNDLLARLAELARESDRPVRDIVGTVERLVGDQATAAYQ
jgi:hypothetical protein